MKSKKVISIIIILTTLLLWITSINVVVRNKDFQISECNNKIELIQTSNQELIKLNDKKDEELHKLKDNAIELEKQVAQLELDLEEVKTTVDIDYTPYLIEFKSLYDKGDWTQDEKDKLIDLFLLIRQNHINGDTYYEYLDETPDMTIGNLIKSGEEDSVDYWRLFRLVEESDGALSEMTFGFIYNRFLEDAEGLFKANFYGKRKHSIISWQLFPYDSEVYSVEYQDEMLAIYDGILKNDSLEPSFREYVEKERKEAEGAFGR